MVWSCHNGKNCEAKNVDDEIPHYFAILLGTPGDPIQCVSRVESVSPCDKGQTRAHDEDEVHDAWRMYKYNCTCNSIGLFVRVVILILY
jgi:hypothetical protein